MTFDQLKAGIFRLRREEERKGASMFLCIPSRWFEKPGPKFRCPNDHVSTMILKSSVKGDLCLECQSGVLMTFPEDQDGPLAIVEGSKEGLS